MLQLILEFIVRTELIVGATTAVLRVMKVKRAAVRHAVWAGVVVVMLLLPEWLIWGPKAYLRVLPNATNHAGVVATAPRMLVNRTLMPQVAAPAYGTHPAPQWSKLALGLYLVGLGVLLARLAIGTARAYVGSPGGEPRRQTHQCFLCRSCHTVGWLHPVVILPEQWLQWPPAQMDAVRTHELEHARRRDPLVQWIALFNRAVFWFHPIAWWIERELSALAEEACDTAVLESGHDACEYSECLLQMARSVMQAGARLNVGMTMPGSFLPQRIRKIQEGGVVPHVSRARMMCAVTACAVMSAALAAGTLAYAPQREAVPREQPRAFESGSFNPPVVRVPEAKPKATPGTSEVHVLAQAQSAPAAQVPPETRRRPDAPDYTLGPNDQLLVRAPKVVEIDEHPFRIDAAGDINLPLLGRVHADGMTVRELEGDLVQRLREKFHAPAPVYFVGAFKAPGIYPLQGSGRLGEMLNATGGLGPDAGGYIKITRRAEYGAIPLPKAIEDAEKKVSTVEISVDSLRDMNPAEDVPLLPLDVISV